MSKLTIDILSDTHNQHEKFTCPGGDILIHAGDCTGRGSLAEAIRFLDWYSKQLYKSLILIPGNHDWIFEQQASLMLDECNKRDIHLLNDSGIILVMQDDIRLPIWGSPVTPFFNNWSFNRFGIDIKPHWEVIPDDTEILITHGPPYGFGDTTHYVNGTPKEMVGCPYLLEKILETQVKLHICGHIHESRGTIVKDSRMYINASSLDAMYRPVSIKPIRIIRELLQDGSILYLEE